MTDPSTQSTSSVIPEVEISISAPSTSIDDLVRLVGRLNDCYGQNLTRQYVRSHRDATAAERDEGRPAD